MNDDGNQIPIKDIIKNTIIALDPEINKLNVGESMDRIIARIDSNDMYYKKQIALYNKNKDFTDIIIDNINKLKK